MGSDHHQFKITAKSIEPQPRFVPFFGNSSSWSSSIGHHSWQSDYSVEYSTGDVSVRLVLPNGSHGEPINARFKFILLDGVGRPVPSRTQASSFQNWTARLSWEWHCAGFITTEDLERPEYLDEDGCFTIQCDVTIRPSKAEMRGDAVPPSDLHRHLGALLEGKDGADVTFQLVAGGETFAAHRCVLAARSPVFRAQLFGEMKEGKSAGGGAPPIPIEDMDARVFRSLLTFIYTDSLPETGGDEEEGGDDDGASERYYQRLLAAADMYGLERMKLICQEKLCERIRAGSVATMLALAERHHCRGLKEACFEFLSSSANLDSFAQTDGFDQLTGTCPDVLKELLAKLATVLMFE